MPSDYRSTFLRSTLSVILWVLYRSEKKAKIPLYNINWLVNIKEISLSKAQWSLYVPPDYHSTFLRSAHWLYFMGFEWIWEQTTIISLYNFHWLIYITEISRSNPGGRWGEGVCGCSLCLITFPHSCAVCSEIWEPQIPVNRKACLSLHKDCFTFYCYPQYPFFIHPTTPKLKENNCKCSLSGLSECSSPLNYLIFHSKTFLTL